MKISALVLLATLSSLSYAQEAPIEDDESENIEFTTKDNYYVSGRSIPISISNAPNNQHLMHLAADNNNSTFWSAERYVNGNPVWIDVDLGADQMVSTVFLTPAMYPNGYVNHNIWGRNSAGEWIFITSYSGNATDNKSIQINIPNKHKPVRYLIVETTQNPSWVAWRRIRALGRLATVSGCNAAMPSNQWIQTKSIGDYISNPTCKDYRDNTYIESDGLPVGYTTITCNANALPYGWIRTEAIRSDQCYYRSSFSGGKTYDQAYRIRKNN